MTKSVSIIGAGTAGLSSAFLLSDKYRIDIYDKSKDLGWRYENCIQSFRNYDQDEDLINFLDHNNFIINRDLLHPIFKQIRIAPDGTSIKINSPKSRPAFYNVKRGKNKGTLDNFFLERITKKPNVNIHLNKEVSDIQSLKSDYVLASRGTKNANVGFEFNGLEYHGISSQFPIDTILILFDNDLAPAGYLYVLPFPNIQKNYVDITIGVGWQIMPHQQQMDSNILLARLLSNKTVSEYLKDFILVDELHIYARGGFIKEPKNNVIYIGEEFGGLETGLGFGNINAIKTSIAAKNAIDKNKLSNFMKETSRLGVIKDIEKGVMRRLKMERSSNEDISSEILNLIKIYGESFSYKQYAQHKKKKYHNIFQLIKYIYIKFKAKRYLNSARNNLTY